MTEPEHEPEQDEPTASANQVAKGDFPASPSESETETPGAGHPQGND